jgi:hypothetical protein
MQNDPLPINKNDAAVTLEKRTAAMERWLLFSEAARSDDTHFFCEHWRVTRASMRASFACLYVIRGVHRIESGLRAPEKNMYICTQHIRDNSDSKQQNLQHTTHHITKKQHNTTAPNKQQP